MAIGYISYEHFTSDAADSSQSITIPGICDFIVVGAVAYETVNPDIADQFDVLTIDGEACTHIVGGKYLGNFPAADMWYWVPDTTGSVTLAWETDNSCSDPLDRGRHFYVLYFSGVDQADPIRDSAGDYVAGYDETVNVGTIDSSTSDMLVAVLHSYGGDEPDLDFDSMTEVDTAALYNNLRAATGYRLGTGATEDQDMYGDYPVGVLASIKEAAAGGANPKGVFGHPFRGAFGGMI